MKLRYKILAILSVLLGVFLYGRHTRKPKPVSGPLPENVSEKVTVKNGVVTVQTPTGTKAISGVREGTLTLMKDGTSKLDIKTFGWEHLVGMDGFINGDGGALGLDLRYFYYKQFDALLGVGYAPLNKRLDFWAGIGYTPKTTWVANTTVFAGYSVHNNFVAGLSVRF
jgi:hypothetical protein